MVHIWQMFGTLNIWKLIDSDAKSSSSTFPILKNALLGIKCCFFQTKHKDCSGVHYLCHMQPISSAHFWCHTWSWPCAPTNVIQSRYSLASERIYSSKMYAETNLRESPPCVALLPIWNLVSKCSRYPDCQQAVSSMCGPPTLSSVDWLLTQAINAAQIVISGNGGGALQQQ